MSHPIAAALALNCFLIQCPALAQHPLTPDTMSSNDSKPAETGEGARCLPTWPTCFSACSARSRLAAVCRHMRHEPFWCLTATRLSAVGAGGEKNHQGSFVPAVRILRGCQLCALSLVGKRHRASM